MSDRPQRRFARPEDVSTDYERDLGDPGSFPYTRGIHRDMYAARPWSIRQYAGFGTAEETNRRFRFLIERGQPGLSTAFDLPTQMGLDSDDPRSLGEVGRVGVAVDSVADMERMFDDIPLDEVSTSMTINAPAPVLVAMYYVACERQGRDPAAIRGTAQNDVLKEYVARGTYIYPPAPSLRLAADLIAWCALEAPRFNAISLSGYHMREAGCTAAQEMGFALANALAYVQAVVDRGVDVDEFAPRLSWIFNTQMDFFEEIAKYRALRRMWAHIMRDRFGARDPRSTMLRTHTQTAGSALTLQQPENNIVRAAVQALAAALGGVQSMALSCFDEAIAIPTQRAQTLAVRTQQMLQHEFGITDAADPLGGSWYVEELTDRLEREARELSSTSRSWAAPWRRSTQASTSRRSPTRHTPASSGSPRARTWWLESTPMSSRRRCTRSASTCRWVSPSNSTRSSRAAARSATAKRSKPHWGRCVGRPRGPRT